ncbi:MAG: M24 family metallopeptidase [Alphaproteobacteria bacterium]|nr:M24 family metallopeptidase [Alphaproteobacteria bacterium]
MEYGEKLAGLRKILAREKADAFVLSTGDEFQGEYVADYAQRLAWLTGFDGSAGSVAVTADKAAFFTDGRYTIQAARQVPGGLYEIHNSAQMAPEAWVEEKLGAKGGIAVDPWLVTQTQMRRWEAVAARKNAVVKRLAANPVDALWKDRPAAPAGKAVAHGIAYAGKESTAKRKEIGAALVKAGADLVMLTDCASVAWLLNIRGEDVPYTPFVHAFAMLASDGGAVLYTDPAKITPEVAAHLGRDVRVSPRSALEKDIKACKGKGVMLDPDGAAAWFFDAFAGAKARIVEGQDPCALPKACKNEVELEGMRNAHRRDGEALTKFLRWIKAEAPKGGLDEISAAEKLEGFRKQSNLYRGGSFATISGFGANGAVVHYRAVEATNAKIEGDGLFLVDSGGQYPDGTTDVTRTIAIGSPSEEMKEAYTRVLKGHIAIARCKFPEGTTGSQLDALARYHLWQAGMDYDHGTGHGVGSYLSVHEGPQRISKMGNRVALRPGMILSNEPGYYKAGEFGIRIENLVAVVRSAAKGFLEFETLTRAPLEERLVLWEMMTYPEKKWWENYHVGL